MLSARSNVSARLLTSYLEAPTVLVEKRRGLPMWVIVAGAAVGFSTGAVIRWQRSEAPLIEVAALPVAPPAPAIAVPRAPVPAAPPIAPPPLEPAKEQEIVLPKAPVAASPPEAAPAERAPTEVVVNTVAPPPSRAEPVPGGAAPGRPGDKMLAALERGESALEPSPFTLPRDGVQDGVGAPVRQAENPTKEAGDVAAAPPVADEAMIAALAPPPPAEAPEADLAPEIEPETPAESLFDTGRSPPGAPKVALSFLQWSADPARRFAFISVDGAPSQRVHEGEVTSGMTVAAITPSGSSVQTRGHDLRDSSSPLRRGRPARRRYSLPTSMST